MSSLFTTHAYFSTLLSWYRLSAVRPPYLHVATEMFLFDWFKHPTNIEEPMAPSDQALKSPICPAGMSIKQHDITDKRAVLPQTTSAASSTRNKSIACSLSYTPSSRAQHQKQDTNDSNFVSGIPRAHVLTSLPKHSQYEASSISASASGLRKRTSQTLVGKVGTLTLHKQYTQLSS